VGGVAAVVATSFKSAAAIAPGSVVLLLEGAVVTPDVGAAHDVPSSRRGMCSPPPVVLGLALLDMVGVVPTAPKVAGRSAPPLERPAGSSAPPSAPPVLM
jgi:hypothetical protein